MFETMEKDIGEILFSQEDLKACVSRLAGEIRRDYAGREPILVGILQGSFVFLADLVREIDLPIQVEFMSVASYGSGISTSGKVEIRLDLHCDIAGRDVILVEDILDTGTTLSYLLPQLQERGPASLRLCVLLDKTARRIKDIRADYRGFVIPDAFAVGYGLDFDQKYRNLPYVGVLKPSVYAK